MIIEVDLYSQIRLLHTEGESQRSIAKRLGISRQTVKKYCEGATHPDARKSYSRISDVITKDTHGTISFFVVREFFGTNSTLYCVSMSRAVPIAIIA